MWRPAAGGRILGIDVAADRVTRVCACAEECGP